MNVKRKIFIPMILLTIICGLAVLLSSILLFINEINDSQSEKCNVAHNVVLQEIDRFKAQAHVAALGVANTMELREAIVNDNRDQILEFATQIKTIAQIDYCTITDNTGRVLIRTHDPDYYNDNVAHMPHIRSALEGNTEMHIVQGHTIHFGVSAGTPIYDENETMIGVVSLGFRLDTPEFAHNLRELTGCEIEFFSFNERVSSTLMDEDGLFILGNRAEEYISEGVLTGEPFAGRLDINNRNMLAKYFPLYSADDDEVLGMVFIGRYTDEDTRKIQLFVTFGVVITIAVLLACLVIARYISGIIERRLAIVDLLVKNEEQSKLIMESINYASSIQKNLLPDDTVFEEAFSDYSIIWEPRDVVGGDIYWAKNFDDGTVLCVCDCTGHGTPGALLTMLVVSAFESIITEQNHRETAEILYMIDKRISVSLNVKNDNVENMEINDGCDLAILFVSKDGSVTISSGNIDMFVCDGEKTTRYKGQPIYIGEGRLKSKEEVKTAIIPENSSNKFYVASDGLYDQIGGADRQPFGFRTLQNIILENHHKTQTEISVKIWDAFVKHQGEQMRRDDFEFITFKP